MKQADENNEEQEDSFWSDGSFVEPFDPHDSKKMKTLHLKNDEDMNSNCKKCNAKISAHNRDWHAGMCDDCFNRKYFPDTVKKPRRSCSP